MQKSLLERATASCTNNRCEEAVALLEEAVRSQPSNPELQLSPWHLLQWRLLPKFHDESGCCRRISAPCAVAEMSVPRTRSCVPAYWMLSGTPMCIPGNCRKRHGSKPRWIAIARRRASTRAVSSSMTGLGRNTIKRMPGANCRRRSIPINAGSHHTLSVGATGKNAAKNPLRHAATLQNLGNCLSPVEDGRQSRQFAEVNGLLSARIAGL